MRALLLFLTTAALLHANPVELFDGKSLAGWKASENTGSWSVKHGAIVANGKRSHLFYNGPVAHADFTNFILEIEACAAARSNSGVFIHTAWQKTGWPDHGYEIQINNSYNGHGQHRELKRTGSIYAVRNLTKSPIADDQWFTLRIQVTGKRVIVHVDDKLAVDYIEPDGPLHPAFPPTRRLSSGTIALQAHDPGSTVRFRRITLTQLPANHDPAIPLRPSADGCGATRDRIDSLAARNIPFIDYHVHLRGGMTADKALARQATTGINLGILKNLGQGWPIETDAQLAAFLDETESYPLFRGIQVNDRDWHTTHDKTLLDRLDYILADTMIMPMPDDNGPMTKLFEPATYTIDDPEAWMKRYLKHNLRVLAEPCNILANPTYLPPSVEPLYDTLWTDERMKLVIQAAIDNHVALEINARSGFPRDRFIRHARNMGAKFTTGSNNSDDQPVDMSRCFKAYQSLHITKAQTWVP